MSHQRRFVSSLLAMMLSHGSSTFDAASYFDENMGSSIIRTLHDQASAIAAASRDDVCTIILFGALWDGHFKAFVKNGNWHDLANEVRQDGDIELAFFQYSGEATGEQSIPPELLTTPTIGSYDWYGYRGGKKLWEDNGGNPTRLCRNNDWDRNIFEWDVDCVREMCRGAGTVSARSESFEML